MCAGQASVRRRAASLRGGRAGSALPTADGCRKATGQDRGCRGGGVNPICAPGVREGTPRFSIRVSRCLRNNCAVSIPSWTENGRLPLQVSGNKRFAEHVCLEARATRKGKYLRGLVLNLQLFSLRLKCGSYAIRQTRVSTGGVLPIRKLKRVTACRTQAHNRVGVCAGRRTTQDARRTSVTHW